jgi:hypothetical protein
MSPKNRPSRSMLGIAVGHGIRCCAFLLPFLIANRGAQASGNETKERAAKTACLSGDAAKGVALLAELYVNTNDATYIFNQGRCFEQNGRYAEAIVRFREFLRKNTDADKATDAVAQKHIADCQALLGKEAPQPAQAAQPVQPVQAPADSQPAQPAAVQVVPVVPVVPPTSAASPTEIVPLAPIYAAQTGIAQTAPARATPGSGLRIVGIATMAVGVAGIATGVILNIKANSLASELEASTTSYRRNRESARASYETFGWVSYGAGAACVVGGTIFYYLGHRQGRNAQLAFVPTAGPGQVGAILQGAF